MKNDSQCLWFAHIDVENIKFSKSFELGIDFSNQIDAWSKMEFKFRHQIQQMRDHGTLKKHEPLKDLRSLNYCFREKLE